MNNNVELINHADYIYIDDTDEFKDSLLTWEEEEKILRHDIIEIKEEISQDDNIDLKFYQELVNCESVLNQIEDFGANITSKSDLSECINNDSGESIDVVSVTQEQSLINHNVSVLFPNCSTTNETTLLPQSRTLRDRQKLKRIVPTDLETESTVKVKFKRGKKKKRQVPNITKKISKIKTIIPREKPKKRFEKGVDRRIEHNNKEIQRRSELRDAFENLQYLVPKLQCRRDRAPKITILQEASIYCKQLTVQNRWQQNEFVKLCREQERLSNRISKLQ